MNDLTITTTNTPIELVTFNELPEEVKPDFDYCEAEQYDDKRYAFFRDTWYDTSDVQLIRVGNHQDLPIGWAMYVSPEHPFAKWQALISETFFSGILIRYVVEDGCCDAVIMGSYYS